MDNLSAIQQAQRMFKKLVDSKSNTAAKPMQQMRTFPVATLPGGKVVLSNGQTRTSYPAQRAQEIQQTNFNQMKSPQQTADQIKGMNMEINIPARDLALGGPTGQNYFVNLLAQILKPKMQGAPELGPINTILPGIQNKIGEVAQTSALSNLPQLAPDAKSAFDNVSSFYKKYLANSGSAQQALAEDFLAQYNNQQGTNVNMGNIQKYMPLSQNYQSRFGIPSANNARYASIGANSAQAGLKNRI